VPLRKTVSEADMRASDADRDRVVDILRDALAEGRLSTEEFQERLDTLYAAKTMGELVPLTRDLPAPGRQAEPVAPRAYSYDAAAHAHTEPLNLIGIFGGAVRKGRWRVGSQIKAIAVMGGVVIDLTEAVFESPEVTINCVTVMGGVEIRVPENVSLQGGGVVGIMGGSEVREHLAEDPNAPVVKVTGYAIMGGVEAKRKKGKRITEWGRKLLDP
jgi:Domain of unknown function (DUF1707)/Cell wall-active antibiotics response 4TMS YvqF